MTSREKKRLALAIGLTALVGLILGGLLGALIGYPALLITIPTMIFAGNQAGNWALK